MRSVGAARADPGRARADAPRLGGDRGAVLVARDRRRADLLQGGAGHPAGVSGAACSGSARCRRSWSGTARARSAGGGRPTDAFAGVLRAARRRLGDPRRRRRAGQGRCWSARIASCARNFEPGRRFANPLDFQLQLDGWCDQRQPAGAPHDVRAVPAERLVEERARMRPLPAAAAGLRSADGGAGSAAALLRVDRNDYSIDPAFAGRRVEVRVSQTRGDRGRAGHRRARLPAPPLRSPAA